MNINWGAVITAEDKLAQAKQAATDWLKSRIEAAEQGAIGEYSRGEIATWRKQEEAARAVIAESATPDHQAVLSARRAFSGETEAELAAKIVAKADALTDLGMALSGIRSKAQDDIEAATTIAEVDAAKAAAAGGIALATGG